MFSLGNMKITDNAAQGMEHPAVYCGGQMVYFWSADNRPELVVRTWYYHADRYDPEYAACRCEIKLPDGRYGLGRGKWELTSGMKAYDRACVNAVFDCLRPANIHRNDWTIPEVLGMLVKAIQQETGMRYLLTANSLIPVVLK